MLAERRFLMPRMKRKLYDGAVCHILNRGHNKELLFKDDGDYICFKEIVIRYLTTYSLKIYNYCLMPTHYHFLAKIEIAKELAQVMKGIAQTYANCFKDKYPHVGYLYQNRYKSILIDSDDYMLECARYIERNPVRAGLVAEPSHYAWSSYNYYAKGVRDDIITPNFMYQDFGRTDDERRVNYSEFVKLRRPYDVIVDDAMARMK